jgi:biotin-[acetyl-CoA-carboxylase] ligase BirA-like protein
MMRVFTDDRAFAAEILRKKISWKLKTDSTGSKSADLLLEELFENRNILFAEIESDLSWRYLFIVKFAPKSQYEVLIDLAGRHRDLPDRILAIAESGKDFRGFKGRSWASLKGNLHLSAYLAPRRRIGKFYSAFLLLSAVSVLKTIDSFPELTGRANIRWVNDIIIDDGKAGGFLTHTFPQGENVNGVVLGIGLNVESAPAINPSIFNRRACCLREFVETPESCSQSSVFNNLIYHLEKTYDDLIAGGYEKLLDFYRKRSLVLSREVEIHPDKRSYDPEEIIIGKVLRIGDDLELYVEGVEKPVYMGRIRLKQENT